MKKWFAEPKFLFTLLVGVSILAIICGVYLGVALGLSMGGATTALSAAGMLLWAWAWGEFLVMCLRLRRGESAFTASTGRTLRMIGWCMVGLAVVCIACAMTGTEGGRSAAGYDLIGGVILPCFFLAVGAAAKILQDLLTHAMAIEKEQEGVV